MDMHDGTRPAKLSYTHQACVDQILANPGISQGELARMFGYTQAWMSRIIGSDAFQEYLVQRRTEMLDPVLAETIEERIRGVMVQSLDVVARKLEATPTGEFALKAMELTSRALGYGVKPAGGVTLNQQFVVHAPPKSVNGDTWLADYSPAQGPRFVEVSASVSVNERHSTSPSD